MNKFSDSLKSFWDNLIHSISRFPVEALLSFVFFCVAAVGPEGSHLFNISVWFFPLYILCFTLHRLGGSRPWARVAYLLCWLLCIPVYLLRDTSAGTACLVVAYVIAAIILVIGDRKLHDEEFCQGFIRTFIRIVACFIIGGLIALLFLAIIFSIGSLFKLELSDRWTEIPLAFIAFVVIPLLCCSAVSGDRPLQRAERRICSVLDTILSPALIIYTAVLYAYIIRIVGRWELPDSNVAYMVSAFIAAALLCTLLRTILSERQYDWFFKNFPNISVGPLILLWVGIYRRISEYGMTESRFYLVLLAALMTLFTAMLAGRGSRKFQPMAVIMAAVLALFTYIPGIRAKDFGVRSQQKYLEAELPAVLEDGKLPEEIDYDSLIADNALREQWKTVESRWRYLEKNMSKDGFAEVFGQYGEMPFNRWQLDRPEIWADVNANSPVLYQLVHPVDLGAFSMMVPSSDYHYYEDGEAAIFYTDSTKKEVLLKCNIAERIRAGRAGDDLLVYSNDRYLAVFSHIADYHGTGSRMGFTTGEVVLFRKPE